MLFVDLGASSDVRPETLVEFGLMGKIYAERIGMGRTYSRPAEYRNRETKGSMVARKAYNLKDTPFNFVGNVETTYSLGRLM